MDISSSDILALNLRSVYATNQLYGSKRQSNCFFQKGLFLVKEWINDGEVSGTLANMTQQAIPHLQKAICLDKYNQDAIYVLDYLMALFASLGVVSPYENVCAVDASACCALSE